MSLLGVSVSHLGCHVAAISRTGDLIAEGRRTYAPSATSSAQPGVSPRAVYLAFRDLVIELAKATERDPPEAIAFSSAGEVVVPVSNTGQPLGPVLVPGARYGDTWLSAVSETVSPERVFHITGRMLDGPSSLAAICWVRDTQPRTFWDTWRFLPLGSVLAHSLGGTATIDPSLASGTLCFDINTHHWAAPILDAARLAKLKMPDLASAAQPIGAVSATRAREFGLNPNTRLVQGGADLACCALGAGVATSGCALYRIGSSIDLAPCFSAIPITSMLYKRGLPMQPHIVHDLFLSQVRNPLGGRLLQWFIDHFAEADRRQAQREGASIYSRLLSEMPPAPSDLLITPRHGQSKAKNTPLAVDAHGLSLSTTRGEFIRALLEATTFPLMQAQIEYADVGVQVDHYRAAGPGTSSLRWLQIVADMLGFPIDCVSYVNAAAIGAAMLAGIGVNAFSSASEAVEAVARSTARLEPDPTTHLIYQKRLDRYHTATETLSEATGSTHAELVSTGTSS